MIFFTFFINSIILKLIFLRSLKHLHRKFNLALLCAPVLCRSNFVTNFTILKNIQTMPGLLLQMSLMLIRNTNQIQVHSGQKVKDGKNNKIVIIILKDLLTVFVFGTDFNSFKRQSKTVAEFLVPRNTAQKGNLPGVMKRAACCRPRKMQPSTSTTTACLFLLVDVDHCLFLLVDIDQPAIFYWSTSRVNIHVDHQC